MTWCNKSEAFTSLLMSTQTHNEELKQRFTELYGEHADSVFRYANYRISDREKAKDIVQESFVKLWEYMASGEAVENPRALLFRITSNSVIDTYRRKKDSSLDVLQEDGFDPADHEQAESIISKAEGALALSLIIQLDKPLQDVIYLRYVEGLSVKEISEITEERENTVSVRLHRALKELKRIFDHDE